MKYLNFVDEGTTPSGRTRIWTVTTKEENPAEDGVYLGQIKWYGAWRKYCFYPALGSLFDHACLNEIAGFCFEETVRQKVGR